MLISVISEIHRLNYSFNMLKQTDKSFWENKWFQSIRKSVEQIEITLPKLLKVLTNFNLLTRQFNLLKYLL